MRTRVLLIAGLLAIAVVIVTALTPSEPRRSGTNNVPANDPVVRLAPGAEACQSEDVPEATQAVKLRAEAATGQPRPGIRIEGPSQTTVVSDAIRRSGDGIVQVELREHPAAGPSELCVRNRGTSRMTLLGFANDGPRGPFAIDYFRAGRESWWQLAPVVADRAALGKSGLLPSWTLWLAVAMVLSAVALAVASLWRIGSLE